MTHPFDSILLVTLGTAFDAGAERVAFALAQKNTRPLMAIVPLVSNPEFEATAPEPAVTAEQEAGTRITALRAMAEKAGFGFDARVRHGEEPWKEIVAEARERNARLIVCRRYGKLGFLADLLVGEMVGKVVSHAPCNVLMVPRAGEMWRRRILLATDDSPDAERAASVAAEVAKIYSIPVTVVAVAAEGIDALRCVEVAAGTVRGAGVDVDLRVLSGRPSDAIVAIAREIGADLVVVGRRGRDGKDTPRLGPNAERVIGTVECPVLVVTH